MRRDSKLSGVLHVLLHMAEHPGPMTSDDLGRVMQTNPVVIRRIMAGLREQGLVRSEKGHGGGWSISCDFNDVTLRDIYDALGAPEIFAMGNRSESPGCLVEEAVNASLDGAFEEAQRLLLQRLGQVTLAALSRDFHARMVERGQAFDPQAVHEA
ncbi:MAG: Rrf2 family transcriptional regulator [Achromobacter sp.]|jgi:DNA-binding IscR family transcriptional regulator|uniref:Rrf2 family transcriptional regulator n=1 Tax=unclassified Achromobacter TaxID=2626865 RepID=UPI000700F681|nr:Rrf2 family transcriptional regulator [Achromobacter sp. Root565]KRA01723.1 Rrf2 family transcriptional regulator [Achromobacter sp. Root565]